MATNTNQVAVPARAATGFTPEQVALIKRTICKDATDDELALFLYQCKRTGLDPFSRQIHAVKRYDSASQRMVMAVQTGIDGYWLIAERTGRSAGNEEVVYGPQFEPEPGCLAPLWARATVYKLAGGQRVPFTFRARFAEYAAAKRDGKLTKFWREKPFLMLGKCAEAGALRKAFPQELSGLYTSEEMPAPGNDGAGGHLMAAFRRRLAAVKSRAQLDVLGLEIRDADLDGDQRGLLKADYLAAMNRVDPVPFPTSGGGPSTKALPPPAGPDVPPLTELIDLQEELHLDDEGLATICNDEGIDTLTEEGQQRLLMLLRARAEKARAGDDEPEPFN